MDTGKCTIDQVVYNAATFSGLPAHEVRRKRRFIVCPECDGPGYFRKASKSGQAACFGARPHKIGCSLAAPEHEGGGDTGTDEEDERINDGERIVVDFDYGGASGKHIHGPTGTETRRGGSKFIGGSHPIESKMHRRLSTLLRNLITSAQFRQSRQILEIAGHGEYEVKSFFTNFVDVRKAMVGRYAGYWGLISDVRFGDDKTLWFNTGGRNDVSLCLKEEYVDELWARYGISDVEDMAGAYMLVFGEIRSSKNDKKYIAMDGPAHLTIRLAS